jgi:hypothetical protein
MVDANQYLREEGTILCGDDGFEDRQGLQILLYYGTREGKELTDTMSIVLIPMGNGMLFIYGLRSSGVQENSK